MMYQDMVAYCLQKKAIKSIISTSIFGSNTDTYLKKAFMQEGKDLGEECSMPLNTALKKALKKSA